MRTEARHDLPGSVSNRVPASSALCRRAHRVPVQRSRAARTLCSSLPQQAALPRPGEGSGAKRSGKDLSRCTTTPKFLPQPLLLSMRVHACESGDARLIVGLLFFFSNGQSRKVFPPMSTPSFHAHRTARSRSVFTTSRAPTELLLLLTPTTTHGCRGLRIRRQNVIW